MWFKVFLQSSDERQVDCRSRLKISAVCSMFLWQSLLVSYWIHSSMTMCLGSSTRCQQEFFRERNFVGRNFHDLVLDCKNRENFCLMKISRCTCAYVWDIHSGILWLIHVCHVCILFLQISRTVGTDTSRLKVVIGTQYVCQYYYALYVASSPATHSRPSITANAVEGLVKLLRRMMSGGRWEAWHFR